MIEIQCPRCEQYWYANEEMRGQDRLCSRCVDHLRYKHRQRGLIDLPFLVIAGTLLFVDLILVLLAVLKPTPFAKVLLGYGGVQLIGGMIALFGFVKSGEIIVVNWWYSRWSLLVAVSGMFCLLASLPWMKK
jgi:hypothetical protein